MECRVKRGNVRASDVLIRAVLRFRRRARRKQQTKKYRRIKD
jgi:hypothetical protein